MNIVETSGLTKRYGTTVAVDSVDLTVQRGEVYGFLGPNGAGKTTTLRMLLGLVRPTAGAVSLNGRSPTDRGALDGVGALVEGPAFYPFLSGTRNLEVLAQHAGRDRRAVGAALELVGLADRGDDRYDRYSLGMKQRLGLAAALLKEPELLVLDEPTNGLDPAGMAEIRGLIAGLRANGVTVLLSSHILAEVQLMCDRVGIMANGRLKAEASVAELRGAGAVEIAAEPLDRAVSVVTSLAPQGVSVDGGTLRLKVDRNEAAQINATLVRASVEVHALRWREPDLEEVFFELTGGENGGV